MRFLLRATLAAAGFLCLELATRPPRRDVLSDRAAALLIDLADLDRELRTTDPADLWKPPAPVRVPPRPICLCELCTLGAGRV